jgi:hypothetical protein
MFLIGFQSPWESKREINPRIYSSYSPSHILMLLAFVFARIIVTKSAFCHTRATSSDIHVRVPKIMRLKLENSPSIGWARNRKFSCIRSQVDTDRAYPTNKKNSSRISVINNSPVFLYIANRRKECSLDCTLIFLSKPIFCPPSLMKLRSFVAGVFYSLRKSYSHFTCF